MTGSLSFLITRQGFEKKALYLYWDISVMKQEWGLVASTSAIYLVGRAGMGLLPIYGIVRMCVPNSPLFSALPGIWLAPFSQQKVYEWPDFSGFLCERFHFSDFLVYAHIFRSEIFRGCLSSWYYMNRLWYLCNNQLKMGTKNQRAVYE